MMIKNENNRCINRLKKNDNHIRLMTRYDEALQTHSCVATLSLSVERDSGRQRAMLGARLHGAAFGVGAAGGACLGLVGWGGAQIIIPSLSHPWLGVSQVRRCVPRP